MKGINMANKTKKNTASTTKNNSKPKIESKESTITKEVKIENESTTKVVTSEIDPSQYITVLNGYQGCLTYKSSKTGEKFKWAEFGDEQEIELRELRNAKNTHKKYFEKNWFMFDDEFTWVIDYLGVNQYYKNTIKVADFDNIFKNKPDDLKKIINNLSDGQKKAVAFRAKALIDNGEIDSNMVIRTLEQTLGIELIEK